MSDLSLLTNALKLERDAAGYGWVATPGQLRMAFWVGSALKLKVAYGYDRMNDDSWVRITDDDLHLLLIAHGEEIDFGNENRQRLQAENRQENRQGHAGEGSQGRPGEAGCLNAAEEAVIE